MTDVEKFSFAWEAKRFINNEGAEFKDMVMSDAFPEFIETRMTDARFDGTHGFWRAVLDEVVSLGWYTPQGNSEDEESESDA